MFPGSAKSQRVPLVAPAPRRLEESLKPQRFRDWRGYLPNIAEDSLPKAVSRAHARETLQWVC